MKNVLKMFDLKRFFSYFRIIIIVISLLLILNIVTFAYSRYQTSALSNAEASVAFFIVDVGTYEQSIALKGLEPSDKPYIYNFKVSNYNLTGRTNVSLKYTIDFQTTTNLPFNIKIFRNEDFNSNSTNIIAGEEILQEQDNVYYKKYKNNQEYYFTHKNNQTDNYVLVVNFPKIYNTDSDKYQGLIDLFTIKINAKQDI